MAQYSKVGPIPSSYYCNECSNHGLAHYAIKCNKAQNMKSQED
jgi:hypothetical protein